jgi:hypothetical protein
VCFTVSSAFDFYEDKTLRWRLRLFAQLFVPTQHPQRFSLIKVFIIAFIREILARPASRVQGCTGFRRLPDLLLCGGYFFSSA